MLGSKHAFYAGMARTTHCNNQTQKATTRTPTHARFCMVAKNIIDRARSVQKNVCAQTDRSVQPIWSSAMYNHWPIFDRCQKVAGQRRATRQEETTRARNTLEYAQLTIWRLISTIWRRSFTFFEHELLGPSIKARLLGRHNHSLGFRAGHSSRVTRTSSNAWPPYANRYRIGSANALMLK